MTRRQSRRPDRRLAATEDLAPEALADLACRLRYAGAATHKIHPGDYRFILPIKPRPSKSVCDDVRSILRAEAAALFRAGILAGMVSPFEPGGSPKYVWAVDAAGEVYEAKTRPPDQVYHGYRLGDDERDMRRYVLAEWRIRCPKP